MKKGLLITVILLVSISTLSFAQDLQIRKSFFLTDKSGTQISQDFTYLDDFDEAGIAVFSTGGNNSSGYGKIEGAKYGLIDKTGKIVLNAKYDYMYKFGYSDSLYAVQTGELMGIVTAQGKTVLPIIHKDVDYFYDVQGVIKVTTNNDYYQLYNYQGNSLTPVYQYIDNNDRGFVVQQGGYKGLIDKTYKTIIPIKYRELEDLNNGKFLVQDMFLKYYLIDLNGKMVGTTPYDEMEAERSSNDYSKTVGFRVTTKGKKGYVDENLNVILPTSFKYINILDIGCDQKMFAAENKDGQNYLYSTSGKMVSKTPYNYINTSTIFDQYLLVEPMKKPEKKKKKKKKKGVDAFEEEFEDYDYAPSVYNLIDFTGKVVLPDVVEEYTIPYSNNDDQLLLLKSKGTWTAYDRNLKAVLKNPQGSTESFTYMENIDGGLCLVQIGGKDQGYGKPEGGVFGVYNANGEQVIPLTYEDIETIGYGNDMMLKVKKNGKWGLLSLTGSKLTENLYKEIDCNDGTCIVTIENEQNSTKKMGVIEAATGKVNVPTRYDYLERQYGANTYIVSLNNKFGLVDATGNTVLKPKYAYIKGAGLYDKKDVYLANIYGSAKDNYYGGMDIEGGNWGVINTKGDTLTPFKFKEIEFENDSTINVTDLDGFAYLMKFPSLKVITDKEANFIDELGYSYDDKTYLIGKEVTKDEYGYPTGGIYGLSDNIGNKIADYKYAEIKEEGSFIGTYQDFNGFDLMDEKGKVLVENAQSILPIRDTLFFCQKDGKYSIFNTLSKKYDRMDGIVEVSMPDYFYRWALIGVKAENGKWGVVNELGQWIIKATYCDVIGTDESAIIVATCGDGITFKYGVVDAANNVLIPFEYDSIEASYGGEYKCVLGKKLLTKNLMNELLKTEEATDENIR
ncbi:MAG: WG repeat-containing protein [Bacteroidetes bacterium]|nr:WG repeat-containing protein [Bacteroidota bacterium]MBM3424543.1 WG repeat-containing protein [Bacteroidota bacterium]